MIEYKNRKGKWVGAEVLARVEGSTDGKCWSVVNSFGLKLDVRELDIRLIAGSVMRVCVGDRIKNPIEQHWIMANSGVKEMENPNNGTAWYMMQSIDSDTGDMITLSKVGVMWPGMMELLTPYYTDEVDIVLPAVQEVIRTCRGAQTCRKSRTQLVLDITRKISTSIEPSCGNIRCCK
jgi:hypothetical protein